MTWYIGNFFWFEFSLSTWMGQSIRRGWLFWMSQACILFEWISFSLLANFMLQYFKFILWKMPFLEKSFFSSTICSILYSGRLWTYSSQRCVELWSIPEQFFFLYLQRNFFISWRWFSSLSDIIISLWNSQVSNFISMTVICSSKKAVDRYCQQ